LNNIDVLFICNNLGETGAPYRRIGYFLKYFRSRGLKTICIGFIYLTRHGIAKPFEGCYSVPLGASLRSLAVLPLNFLLSFLLIPLILILRPRVIIISIPDSYLVLASYIGGSLVRSKIIIDIRDPQEEIMSSIYKKGLSSFIVKVYKRINYSIYKRAQVVVGVTRTLVTMMASEIRRLIYLIPNGVDLSIFKPLDKEEARLKLGLSRESLLIGCVGGLSSYGYYNILPILTAIRKVRRELSIDIKLVVAGPIYDDYMRRIIEGFRDESVYLGVLDTKGVITLLSACDLGVIPRIGDPIYDYAIPVKFYEYIATGLPIIVIARKCSELAEVVEKNKLGIVCEPQDHICLKSAVTTFATNKTTLDKYKKNVLAFRGHIDRRIGAERLYKLINKLISK
jgi:glycosyltransferase involved in cell wall biosynthesis